MFHTQTYLQTRDESCIKETSTPRGEKERHFRREILREKKTQNAGEEYIEYVNEIIRLSTRRSLALYILCALSTEEIACVENEPPEIEGPLG